VLREPIIFFDANGEDLWGTGVNNEQISERLNKDWITYDPKKETFGVK
jgi:hypothetical protein